MIPSAECTVKIKFEHGSRARRVAHTERAATEIPKLSDVTAVDMSPALRAACPCELRHDRGKATAALDRPPQPW